MIVRVQDAPLLFVWKIGKRITQKFKKKKKEAVDKKIKGKVRKKKKN